MRKTQNRFALVYDHRNVEGWLRRVQMSERFEPFPDSVQVGDLWKDQPIVALAAELNGFARWQPLGTQIINDPYPTIEGKATTD